MAAQSTRASAQSPVSPLAAAHAVFGERPRDVLFHIDAATDGLSWCEAVFHAIEVLHEKGGGEIHIKRLASLGRYVSSDISNHIGAEHDKMAEAIEAAEAGEVQP